MKDLPMTPEQKEFIEDFKNAFPEFKDQDLSQISLETLKGLSKMIQTDTMLKHLSSSYESQGISFPCFTMLISFARDYPRNIAVENLERSFLELGNWFREHCSHMDKSIAKQDLLLEKQDKKLENQEKMIQELKEMTSEIKKSNDILADVVKSYFGKN